MDLDPQAHTKMLENIVPDPWHFGTVPNALTRTVLLITDPYQVLLISSEPVASKMKVTIL